MNTSKVTKAPVAPPASTFRVGTLVGLAIVFSPFLRAASGKGRRDCTTTHFKDHTGVGLLFCVLQDLIKRIRRSWRSKTALRKATLKPHALKRLGGSSPCIRPRTT